ncbi:hypothetical protein [Chitinophaga sp. S165]|uniref:hypothetical protein n=1 Tax=Chitinophaga sp. S165 TaxID=2135462 RepID=UPI000D7196E5|nr:hypothetical protein [Chitinophaga sp. S165]PWV55560.1 hypothetical protein C7475_10166 [Chitinophaga sp. S165]
MKNLYTSILTIFLLAGCTKTPDIRSVITKLELSKRQLPADGQSSVELSVILDSKASSDRRSVIFSASAGSFSSGNDKVTAKAEFDNGVLVAKATLKAPFEPGTIMVTVQPEFDSPITEFVLTDSITATFSEAATITLNPSSFGIGSNHLNEIQLTARIRNIDKRNVSKGVNVLLEDSLVTGGPALGSFRDRQTMTADSSKVSAWYSAAMYPIGTAIRIRATVLDKDLQKTGISDAITITVNL